MYVNPANLRRTIVVFEKSNTGIDSAGFPKIEERIVRTCKAQMTRISASEVNRAEGDWKNEQLRFLVRSTNTEITRDMFVRYCGCVFEILYVNDYGDRHEYTEIMTSRTVKA